MGAIILGNYRPKLKRGLMFNLSQMSKDLRISIIDKNGRIVSQNGWVSRSKICTYCGSPTVAYNWCGPCLTDMAVIKQAIQNKYK